MTKHLPANYDLSDLVGRVIDSTFPPQSTKRFTALNEHCLYLRYRLYTTCDGSCASTCAQCGN